MTCLEWVAIILALGVVSMIEICAITTCVGKVFDAKMRTTFELQEKLFDKEMTAITKLLDVYFEKFTKLIDKC